MRHNPSRVEIHAHMYGVIQGDVKTSHTMEVMALALNAKLQAGMERGSGNVSASTRPGKGTTSVRWKSWTTSVRRSEPDRLTGQTLRGTQRTPA